MRIYVQFLRKIVSPDVEIELIHDSLVDLAEHEYFNKIVDRLLAGLLELLHEEEGLPPCHAYRCELQRKRLHNNIDSNDNS